MTSDPKHYTRRSMGTGAGYPGGRSMGSGSVPPPYQRTIVRAVSPKPRGEWLSPDEFHKRFAARFGTSGASAAIRNRLDSGHIAVRVRGLSCDDESQNDLRMPVGFWSTKSSDREEHWGLGDFSARVDDRKWRAFGVEFAEVEGMEIGLTEAAPSNDRATSINEEQVRAVLPPSASSADRKNEEFAHAAAALVRKGGKLSEAIRAVAPTDDQSRAQQSIERGIRKSYDIMYDKSGNPF